MVDDRQVITNDCDHPGYEVAERADPHDAHEEGDGEPIFEPRPVAVRYGADEYQVYRPRYDPRSLPDPAVLPRPDRQLKLVFLKNSTSLSPTRLLDVIFIRALKLRDTSD